MNRDFDYQMYCLRKRLEQAELDFQLHEATGNKEKADEAFDRGRQINEEINELERLQNVR